MSAGKSVKETDIGESRTNKQNQIYQEEKKWTSEDT